MDFILDLKINFYRDTLYKSVTIIIDMIIIEMIIIEIIMIDMIIADMNITDMKMTTIREVFVCNMQS